MRDAGNFFFAGARIFFQSLEAAIFLFSRVARIPEGSLVLPAICTEERITLGAELVRRTARVAVLVHQSAISTGSDTGRHHSGCWDSCFLSCRPCSSRMTPYDGHHPPALWCQHMLT